MKYILKIIFLIYIITLFSITNQDVPYTEILVLVLIIGINVFKERFYDTVYSAIPSFILICFSIWLDRNLILLLAIPIYDFIFQKKYLGIIPVLMTLLYFSGGSNLPLSILVTGISGVLAFIIARAEQTELSYKTRLDDERRLRYELEQTKAKLLNSAKEIAHLTEVRERNRIARDIHDNIGHSIAGILIQLQAAEKLYDRDSPKAKDILHKTINSLSDALALLRDTVHNIKPKETLGVEYIKSVIDDFGFCPVDFKFRGNFSLLPSNQLEILASNIKEALTNAARHSKASKVDITIEINEKFTRLYIKDNGIGCDKIKEGLGISGMRERVQNIGGSIAVSSDNGFLIVILLPVNSGEGSGLFAGTNS